MIAAKWVIQIFNLREMSCVRRGKSGSRCFSTTPSAMLRAEGFHRTGGKHHHTRSTTTKQQSVLDNIHFLLNRIAIP